MSTTVMQAPMPAVLSLPAPTRAIPVPTVTIPCDACGTRFHKRDACRIGNSDYCPSCDQERWNELIALQEELHYGSAALLSDALDHSFAGMF